MAPKKKLPTFEEYQETERAELIQIAELLSSKSGAVLINHLEGRFDRSLVARVQGGPIDDKQTLINVGAREVVHYLRSLLGRDNS
jgi:hypothetical protein